MLNSENRQMFFIAISRKIKPLSIVLFFSMFASFCVLGQTENTMSNADIDSTLKANYPMDPKFRDLGVAHYKNLLKHSIANKHRKGTITSYHFIGNVYSTILNQQDSAVFYYDKAILLMEQHIGQDSLRLLATYLDKGISIGRSGMEFLAVEYLEKAYELALAMGNENAIQVTRTNLADFNKTSGNYEKAIELAKELLKDYPAKDNEWKLGINRLIGSAMVQANKPEEALPFLKIADSLYQVVVDGEKNMTISLQASIINSRNWKAQAHIDLGDYEKAIDICETMFSDFPDYPGSFTLTKTVLGSALLKDGQTQKAVRVLEEALELQGSPGQKRAIMKTLGLHYLSQKNFKKSKPLLTELIEMGDSVELARSKRFARYSSISYNLLETQYKNDALSHKNEVLEAKAKQREYIVGLLILSVAILLLSILGYILWKKYHSGKKTIKNLKANEKAIMEAHIKLREDELSATMAHLGKSMKTLESISTDLGKSIRDKDYAALEHIKRALKEHQESSSATSLLTDRVESQYPRMTAQLREMYPNFTPNDVKHCLMIKLGLSLKETAQLFNITVAAVKSARGRMRKKMGLDRDISLRQHLSYVAKSA